RGPSVSAWCTAAACMLLTMTSCADASDKAGSPIAQSEALSSTPAPTPTDPVLSPRPGEVLELDRHGPEYVFTKEGRYAVRLNPHLVYEVDVPDMWEVYRGRYFSTSVFSGGTGIFSVSGPVTEAWLPTDPCRDRSLVQVGPTARDLAEALAAQGSLTVTKPTQVAIAGRQGAYVEIRIPDRVNSAMCEGGAVAVFTSKVRPPDWWDMRTGEVVTYWIVDVDGQRWIVAGVCDTVCTDADFEVLAGMAESVTLVSER
ncbi:MAG TPA: hypothetical protein VLI04_08200, partial [Nocardioidaceae bacterium]|nr:hypothetical protein [Nocardioidaceae bacterium]